MDGAQGSNHSKTNPMSGSPNDREKRTVLLDETHSLIQIYHPIFSIDNYESSVSLEIALQQVFDHAKLQLPEDVKKRVIQRWQFRGHGDNLNAGLPAVAGLLQGHTRDLPARAGVWQRDQACLSLVRHGAPLTVYCRQRTVYDNLCFLHKFKSVY